jgi:HPt (histidine-containing phosphotransfer) domain-containing protein
MSEPIDLPDVMERVQDDKELLLDLFDIFQEDFVAKSAALKKAIADNDMQKVKEVAHSVKGASGNISAKGMYATALQIEQSAKEENMAGVGDLASELDKQFAQVQAYIIKIKPELS